MPTFDIFGRDCGIDMQGEKIAGLNRLWWLEFKGEISVAISHESSCICLILWYVLTFHLPLKLTSLSF